MKNDITVDKYIQKHPQWEKELTALRRILLSTPLLETIKWGAPVYTLNGKNVVGLGAFKSYVGLWFFQGALLRDARQKLINAQENKTRALRQWRFTSQDEIQRDLETIKAFLQEAITNQQQGRTIPPLRNKPFVIPKELQALLSSDKKFKESFETLSRAKQREYAEYIAEARRPETRQRRLEKIVPMILAGAGLYDQYEK